MLVLGRKGQKYSWSLCMNTKPKSAQITFFSLLNALTYIFLFSFIFLLLGCNSSAKQGRFELNLLSSVFGDISISQGKTGTAVVAINRNVDSSKFAPTIDMRLIDPPSWLAYQFEKNPVEGNTSTIKLDIGKDAKPGIYRLILHGTGNTPETVIEDSVTFHLVIEKSKSDSSENPNSAMIKLKEKVLALLNL